MKKVLSVAMASAMVLGMGANAFAIKYNTSSNDTAKWPEGGLKFEGNLFVTDKDNKLVKDATTKLAGQKSVDFQPGDVIWMPLYADNQVRYDSEIEGEKDTSVEGVSDLRIKGAVEVKYSSWYWRWNESNKYWEHAEKADAEDWTKGTEDQVKDWLLTNSDKTKAQKLAQVKLPDTTTVEYNNHTYNVVKNSEKYFIGATEYYGEDDFVEAVALNGAEKAFITVKAADEKGTPIKIGDAFVKEEKEVRKHGQYTGNIDKNWSVNLLEEKGTTLTDVVEKAELYKATEKDYHSYKNNPGVAIQPNAVYVRVHLKDDWKFCNTLDMKYYVYVADNKGNASDKVWVSGKYAAAEAKTVDFTWSNDASVASLWKAKENGVAVFDFADKAFFTVKMYKDECLYLDLDAAYKLATAKEFDSEIDSFYYFDTENANFVREGELVIVSDNADLAVYEIAEDEIFDMEAEYVTNYAVAHTNEKINGYVFNTAELGKYVLADEIVVEDEDEAKEEEKPAEEVKPSEDAKEETVKPNKVNPNTGANDFVGLAVSLAVVSVAAAGALALKK